MPMPDDTDLSVLIRAGDRDAFERLFRDWYARLATYAVRLVGSRDAAEDIVQELFVTLWNRRDQLPDMGALPGYLHRAVRNRALNDLRRRRTAERWLALRDPDPVDVPVAVSTLVEAELAGRIQAALGALPPRTREVFLLHRDQGLTYGGIAAALGISVKTVETLMSRALRSLRQALADLRAPEG